MYEDIEPLFINLVLPLLAIALADQAFQDYSTFKEIENIPPPENGSLHHLRIKDEMLSVLSEFLTILLHVRFRSSAPIPGC